jgi:hypothetical protein
MRMQIAQTVGQFELIDRTIGGIGAVRIRQPTLIGQQSAAFRTSLIPVLQGIAYGAQRIHEIIPPWRVSPEADDRVPAETLCIFFGNKIP